MSRALGASTFIWTSPMRDEELGLVRHVADLGFDVVEACLEQPDLLTPSRLAVAAADAGLAVSVCGAFSPERDVSDEDPAVRATGVDYLRRCVDVAAEVGSPHVAGPMYAGTGVTRLLPDAARRAQRDRAADALRGVAEHAAAAGVRLAIEPLNRYETDLVNTIEQGLDLCDRIGLDNVGLMLDTYHLNIEERSVGDAIRSAGARCFHVQASENDRGAPGAGHVPWREVADALDDIGYGGWVVIESFVPTIVEIARAVSLWRPLAESPDALARDGLAFLKGVLA
jgi:D-psicose/D-tagatose/L-ribulose 3-epimerase